MKKKIRILHVVSALDGGGVENVLINYYRNMNTDEIKFDFIVHEPDEGALENEFRNFGSKIWHVTPKRNNLFKNITQIHQIIKNNDYKIIHCHQDYSSVLPLSIAKIYGIPIRIAHSHSAKKSNSNINRLFRKVASKIIEKTANYYFSCGNDAGFTLFGKKWGKEGELMNNAIDLQKFEFSMEVRKEYREQLGVNKELCFLHVGRFADVKNHSYLVDLLTEYNQVNDNWKMIFVGEGELKNQIMEQVKILNLEKKIKFLGLRRDVNHIMSAADILFLPSKSEGLPVSVIEAQAAGLIVLASDQVPNEVKLSNLVSFLPLNADKKEWLQAISRYENYDRGDYINLLKNKGYCIKNEAIKYQNWIYDKYM